MAPAVPILPITASTRSLAWTCGGSVPGNFDAHVPALALCQALGGQHVLHLGGADALGEGGEGAVRRGVRIPADDRHAGQRRALLGPHDVNDALPHVVERELLYAEVAAVGIETFDLDPGRLVGDAGHSGASFAGDRRHVVIGGGEVRVEPPRLAPRETQALESLWRGDLVQQVPVDVDQPHAVGSIGDEVRVPDLVVKGLAAHRWKDGVVGRWGILPVDAAIRNGAGPRLLGDGLVGAWIKTSNVNTVAAGILPTAPGQTKS